MLDSKTYKYIDPKDLSSLGLIYKINKEILHQWGLALGRDPDDNLFCIINKEPIEYDEAAQKRGESKLKEFSTNFKNIKNKYFEKDIN